MASWRAPGSANRAELGVRGDGEPDAERGAAARSGAVGRDGPAVRLDQMADDREAEPEPAVDAGRRGVRLAEALEDVRGELGGIPMPLSRTESSTAPPTCASRTSTRPPVGVNLMAFESRFQATCCSRPGSPATSRRAPRTRWLDRDLPRGRRRPHRLDGRLEDRAEIDGPDVQPELPAHDPRHVEQVVHDLGLGAGAALDGLDRARHRSRVELPAAEQARPPSTELSGVRSSCESVAMNSSLARLACSASARASRSRARRATRSSSMRRRCAISARSAASTSLRRSSIHCTSQTVSHTTTTPVTMAETTTRETPTIASYFAARRAPTTNTQPSAIGRSAMARSSRRAVNPALPRDTTTRMKPCSGRASRIPMHSTASATPAWTETWVSGLSPPIDSTP